MSEIQLPLEIEDTFRNIAHKCYVKDREKLSIKVYVDMDGTLVDFISQVNKLNYWRSDKEEKVDWNKVKAMGPCFWSEMDWIDGAEEGFKKLQDMEYNGLIDLYILSSIDFEDGRMGKKEWIKSHTNFPLEKVIFVQEPEDKANYADTKSILIDDREKSLKPFTLAGGYSIEFKDLKIFNDWENVVKKIAILTDKCFFKMSKIIEKYSINGIDYEVVETICIDDLRVVNIENITEHEIEMTIIHLPFFYNCYNEIAKYYKDIEKSKVLVAGIEDMSPPKDFIFCGTPFVRYENCIKNCSFYDVSIRIKKDFSFNQLFNSCVTTFIETCKSKEKNLIIDLKKNLKIDEINN